MNKNASILQAELKELISKTPARVKVIDVRNREEYDTQHIPFAINIPLAELSDYLENEKGHPQIITICNRGGDKSQYGAALCREKGFNNSRYPEGGIPAWFEREK